MGNSFNDLEFYKQYFHFSCSPFMFGRHRQRMHLLSQARSETIESPWRLGLSVFGSYLASKLLVAGSAVVEEQNIYE